MNAIVEPPGARRAVPQPVNRLGGESSFLQKFAAAAFGRILAGIDEAAGQLPSVLLHRRTILPHQWEAPAGRACDDRDVIGLFDRVIKLRRRAARELDLALDDAHPRRDFGGPALADSRPFPGHAMHPTIQLCAVRTTVAGGRRSQVVAKA
jgi:hypothetical protein